MLVTLRVSPSGSRSFASRSSVRILSPISSTASLSSVAAGARLTSGPVVASTEVVMAPRSVAFWIVWLIDAVLATAVTTAAGGMPSTPVSTLLSVAVLVRLSDPLALPPPGLSPVLVTAAVTALASLVTTAVSTAAALLLPAASRAVLSSVTTWVAAFCAATATGSLLGWARMS